jgi:hypothetical protein
MKQNKIDEMYEILSSFYRYKGTDRFDATLYDFYKWLESVAYTEQGDEQTH